MEQISDLSHTASTWVFRMQDFRSSGLGFAFLNSRKCPFLRPHVKVYGNVGRAERETGRKGDIVGGKGKGGDGRSA